MKLFVVAALIAVASAARLEHLERSYLPPDNNHYSNFNSNGAKGFGANTGSQNDFGAIGSASNVFGNGHNSASNGFNGASNNGFRNGQNSGSNGFGLNGHSSNGFGSSSGSNGFGANGHSSNGFGSHQGSNGFGANGHSSNGFGSSQTSNGFGSSQGSNGFGINAGAAGKNSAFPGATSNQYLPPDHGPSSGVSNGFNGNGPSSQSSSGRFPSQQYNQGSQYSSLNSAGSNFGLPRGSASGSFGSQDSFDSQPQFGAASRQYLAPKSSSFQNIPQQAFDEQTGYHY